MKTLFQKGNEYKRPCKAAWMWWPANLKKQLDEIAEAFVKQTAKKTLSVYVQIAFDEWQDFNTEPCSKHTIRRYIVSRIADFEAAAHAPKKSGRTR